MTHWQGVNEEGTSVASLPALPVLSASQAATPSELSFLSTLFPSWNPRPLGPMGDSAHLQPLVPPALGRLGPCVMNRQQGTS